MTTLIGCAPVLWCNSGSTSEGGPKRRVVERRYIHLDLKGAPPQPGYLLRLLPFFAQWGATGLLIEWEDVRISTPSPNFPQISPNLQ